MKFNKINLVTAFFGAALLLVSCNNDDDNSPMQPNELDFSGTYMQQDQMVDQQSILFSLALLEKIHLT